MTGIHLVVPPVPWSATAWCTIAAAEGFPIQQVEPLLTRAWQALAEIRR